MVALFKGKAALKSDKPAEQAALTPLVVTRPVQAGASFAPRPPAASAPLSAEQLRAKIAETAYGLYLQRGCAEGHDREDWLAAERKVLSKPAIPGK